MIDTMVKVALKTFYLNLIQLTFFTLASVSQQRAPIYILEWIARNK